MRDKKTIAILQIIMLYLEETPDEEKKKIYKELSEALK